MQGTGLTRGALIRRVISYTLMVVAVVCIATILIFLMLGYRFNRYNGTIQQGGLVQFVSQPSNASIKVGDILLAKKTRAKITLTPGDYLVTMQKDGYRDWAKNVTVKAGAVLWLNSVRFVPNDPKTTSALDMKTLDSMSVRGNTVALLQVKTVPTITLVDIGGDTVKTKDVIVPASVVSSKAATYTLSDWLSDRYVLLKRTVAKASDWVVVDTDSPERSIVIGATKNHLPLEVMSDPRSPGAVLVRYSDGTVTSEAISSQRVTQLPIENVASMTSDDDTLFYVTAPRAGQVMTGYLTLGDTRSQTLRTFETDKVVRISSGQYFSTHYIATSVGMTTYIDQVGSLPSSGSDQAMATEVTPLKTITTSSGVLFSDFRANGRFVVLQQRDSLTTFDVELMKQSDVPIVGAKNLQTPLKWLDQFHFWSDVNGYVRQYEFDGTNQVDIVAVAPGFSSEYSSNGKYLYTIGKTATGYSLQQTRMIFN